MLAFQELAGACEPSTSATKKSKRYEPMRSEMIWWVCSLFYVPQGSIRGTHGKTLRARKHGDKVKQEQQNHITQHASELLLDTRDNREFYL